MSHKNLVVLHDLVKLLSQDCKESFTRSGFQRKGLEKEELEIAHLRVISICCGCESERMGKG